MREISPVFDVAEERHAVPETRSAVTFLVRQGSGPSAGLGQGFKPGDGRREDHVAKEVTTGQGQGGSPPMAIADR